MSFETIEKLYTPKEYLVLEEPAEFRSEFSNGRIYAMAGTSRNHSHICVNLTREMSVSLLDRPCSVYGSDMRVKSSETVSYFYPDISVVCGREEFEDLPVDNLLNPILICEVLSPSTEAFDRGDKFGHYQRIPSLQEYVLVSQNKVRIEVFSRNAGLWTYDIFEDIDAQLSLKSIECRIPIQAIYHKVELPSPAEIESIT